MKPWLSGDPLSAIIRIPRGGAGIFRIGIVFMDVKGNCVGVEGRLSAGLWWEAGAHISVPAVSLTVPEGNNGGGIGFCNISD